MLLKKIVLVFCLESKSQQTKTASWKSRDHRIATTPTGLILSPSVLYVKA